MGKAEASGRTRKIVIRSGNLSSCPTLSPFCPVTFQSVSHSEISAPSHSFGLCLPSLGRHSSPEFAPGVPLLRSSAHKGRRPDLRRHSCSHALAIRTAHLGLYLPTVVPIPLFYPTQCQSTCTTALSALFLLHYNMGCLPPGEPTFTRLKQTQIIASTARMSLCSSKGFWQSP